MSYLVICQVFHLVSAIVLHEIAHGVTAFWLGDNTAHKAGRLTLNPISHIDPFMSVIVPGLLILSGSPLVFGAAKPVPVDPRQLRINPFWGMAIVAAAGPFINGILALIWALGLRIVLPTGAVDGDMIMYQEVLLAFFAYGIGINVSLGILNLLPLLPLDGGRILAAFLPRRLALEFMKLEKYGFVILIVLLSTGMLDGIFTFAYESVLKILLGACSGNYWATDSGNHWSKESGNCWSRNSVLIAPPQR